MGGILSQAMGASATGGSNDIPGVLSFHSSDRWKLHFKELENSSQLMVVDFTASWCGPCELIAPAVKDLASKYTNVLFAQIDVDELKDVAQDFEIKGMPTFVLVKRGKEVDRVVGAKMDELKNKIDKHRVI